MVGCSSSYLPFSFLPYLGYTVLVSDHSYDVVQGQQGVALDLGVDVLALSADRQQLHQVNVVHHVAALAPASALSPHHMDQGPHGGTALVDDQAVPA